MTKQYEKVKQNTTHPNQRRSLSQFNETMSSILTANNNIPYLVPSLYQTNQFKI